MKKYLIFSFVMLAVAIVATRYAFMNHRNGVAYVIPLDARAVMMVNAKELVSSLDLEFKDILRLAKDFELSEQEIDLACPAYAFVTADGLIGMTAKVSHESKLKELLCKHFQLEEQRGMNWLMAMNWQVCFDKDKLLAIGPVSEGEAGQLRNKMAELMKQKDDNACPLLNDVQNQKGFIRLLAQMDAMPESISKEAKQYMKGDIDLSDIRLAASLELAGKSLSLHIEFLTENEKLLKHQEEYSAMLRPIKGDLITCSPENPLFWACMNVKGEDLLMKLREDPSIRTKLLALNLCVDADMMIKSIDGDVSLSMPKFRMTSSPCVVMASLSNQDFLKNVPDWKQGYMTSQGVRFEVMDRNAFMLHYDGTDVFFGVKDDKLYLTPDSRLASNVCTPCENSRLQEQKQEICQNCFYATVDLKQVIKEFSLYTMLLQRAYPALYEGLLTLNRFNVKVENATHVTLEITTDKEIKELLNALIKK